MRFFLLLIFLFCCIYFSCAQPPDHPISNISGDTIEVESTDSTIVYIIKKAPVTIKQRIEIQRSKLKKHIYFSLGLGSFANTNTYKPRDGNEAYVSRLNSSTNPKIGYSTIIQLYNAPRKNILGFMIEGKRINEEFRYTAAGASENTFENSYTYGSFGIMIGRWYRKERKISYQFIGVPAFNYKFGVSGYSLNQNNAATIYIEEAVGYHKLYMTAYLSGRVLLKLKESFIEIAPYVILSPFSMTKKTETFSIRRHFIGMSLIITQKIF